MKPKFFITGLILLACLISIAAAADPYAGYVPSSISGVEPLNVTFTDISYGGSLTYSWTYRNVAGSNTTTVFSTAASPTYSFNQGNYSIQLTTTNSLGTNVSPHGVFVNVSGGSGLPPVADFAATIFTVPALVYPVKINDTSTNTPTSWAWNVCSYSSDGYVSYGCTAFTTKNISYTPSRVGYLNVQLTATNLYGSNTMTKNNYITVTGSLSYDGLVSNFTPVGTYEEPIGRVIDVEMNSTVQFVDTSTGSTLPTAWQWEHMDSGGSHYNTTQNSTFRYDYTNSVDGGTYRVTLYVNNGVDSEASSYKYVRVSVPPVVPIPELSILNHNTGETHINLTSGSTTNLTVHNGDVVQFWDTSYNSPSTRIWSINAGNGSTYTYYTPTVNFTYTNAPAGLYGVTLSATNTAGTGTASFPTLIKTTDATSPGSVTGLVGTPGVVTIMWNWTAPTNPDFSHVMTWNAIDGLPAGNASGNGVLWSGLLPNTTYSIATKTVDIYGNVNATFVNASATTSVPYWNITTIGASTWTCPPGVTAVNVKLYGGGGSGAGGDSTNGGLGGEAGDVVEVSRIEVIPGNTYDIYVGKGGDQHVGSPVAVFAGSNAGSATSFQGYSARGGSGGTRNTWTWGGNGSAGYLTPLFLAQNGTPSGGTVGGTSGQGYSAGGGGAAVWLHDTPVDGSGLGGFGAQGMALITVFGYQTGNSPNFEADTTSGAPGTLVHFTDTSTLTNTAGLTYNWSFGDGTYSSEYGDTQHVFAYLGSYDITLILNSSTESVTETKHAYINIINKDGGKINTLYPRETSFTLVDKYGRVLPDVTVTATMTSSSVEGTDWLTSMFGLADDSINSTVLSDTTDDSGQVVFPMIASGRYHMTFVDLARGINEARDVHPSQINYIYILTTDDTAIADNKADFINVTLGTYPPKDTNPAMVYLTANYTDLSGTTNRATFYVLYPNQTPLYSENLGGASTSYAQYPVQNRAGGAYIWGINATTTKFGELNKVMGITLSGNGENGMATNLIKPGCNNWGCT